MIDKGVDANNATDLAGNAALATGSGLGLAGAAAPFAAPLAVGGGSFLAGKAAGGALVEGLLKGKIDSTIGQNKNIPNDAEVKRIIAANPDGNLARYMRSQKDGGGFTSDALPSAAPAAAPVLPASQQMSPAQTLRVNAQINNGSLRAEDLAPGTGYVTRSDGTMGTKFNAQPFGQAAKQTAQVSNPADDFQAKLYEDANSPIGAYNGRGRAEARSTLTAMRGQDTQRDVAMYNKQLGYAQLNREQYNDNAAKVDDFVKSQSVEPTKDGNGTQFSSGEYKNNTNAWNAALAGL
jgi:hypothetical protein